MLNALGPKPFGSSGLSQSLAPSLNHGVKRVRAPEVILITFLTTKRRYKLCTSYSPYSIQFLAAKFKYREIVIVKTKDQWSNAFKWLSIFGNGKSEG